MNDLDQSDINHDLCQKMITKTSPINYADPYEQNVWRFFKIIFDSKYVPDSFFEFNDNPYNIISKFMTFLEEDYQEKEIKHSNPIIEKNIIMMKHTAFRHFRRGTRQHFLGFLSQNLSESEKWKVEAFRSIFNGKIPFANFCKTVKSSPPKDDLAELYSAIAAQPIKMRELLKNEQNGVTITDEDKIWMFIYSKYVSSLLNPSEKFLPKTTEEEFIKSTNDALKIIVTYVSKALNSDPATALRSTIESTSYLWVSHPHLYVYLAHISKDDKLLKQILQEVIPSVLRNTKFAEAAEYINLINDTSKKAKVFASFLKELGHPISNRSTYEGIIKTYRDFKYLAHEVAVQILKTNWPDNILRRQVLLAPEWQAFEFDDALEYARIVKSAMYKLCLAEDVEGSIIAMKMIKEDEWEAHFHQAELAFWEKYSNNDLLGAFEAVLEWSTGDYCVEDLERNFMKAIMPVITSKFSSELSAEMLK